MQGRLVAVLALVLTMLAVALGDAPPANTPPPRDLSLAEYQTELERIAGALAPMQNDDAAVIALHDSIADAFRVTAGGRQFIVDNTKMKLAIGEYKIAKPARRAELVAAVKLRLQELRDEAAAFENQPRAAERNKLDEILSRKEFNAASGPTILEIWKQRVEDWISKWLEKMFGHLPSRQQRNDTAAWILIAIAICVLAIWIKRRAGRREPESVRMPVPFSPSAKGWRTWLAEARAAAAQNRWRDAVHLAYWAGIANLEEHGAWVPDRARTPREYLDLISKTHPKHDDLMVLTRRFELTWYGREDADAADFEATLRQLETLGCR